jgi:hypothetical protein
MHAVTRWSSCDIGDRVGCPRPTLHTLRASKHESFFAMRSASVTLISGMEVRRTNAGVVQRAPTGPLPRLPQTALAGVHNLERRALPGLFLAAFVGLIVVQIWLALG